MGALEPFGRDGLNIMIAVFFRDTSIQKDVRNVAILRLLLVLNFRVGYQKKKMYVTSLGAGQNNVSLLSFRTMVYQYGFSMV